jgi:gas vesicle protein
MSNGNKNYAPGLITALLIGAAAGFMAGLLFAPKSGKETRRELTEKGEEFFGKSREGLETAKTKLIQAKDTGKEILDRSREFIQKTAKDMEEGAEKARKKVENVIEKGKKTAKKVEDSLS